MIHLPILYLALWPSAARQAPQVTIQSMLPEMVDLMRLTGPPSPAYTHAQASSYDRASVAPDKPGWFANADYGQYVRTEKHGDRTESVMADLKGPGAVDRLWSANPLGTIRFYFDGEETPRIEAPMADLLTGKVAKLGQPFGYMASSGCNLYFPFPYAKSLKITVGDPDAGDKMGSLYYHVGYRTYAEGTTVRTFAFADLAHVAPIIRRVARIIASGTRPNTDSFDGVVSPKLVTPGKSSVLEMRSVTGSVSKQYTVRVNFPSLAGLKAGFSDPRQPHNVLRNLILQIWADGELCVRSPLGDFFGTAPGQNPYVGLPMEMRADGTMICRFPMPFKHSLKATIENRSHIPIELGQTFTPFGGIAAVPPYRFHAQWTGERGATRPMRDMNFLTATGQGYWIGSMLSVANPVGAWWGEGDEKVWVDGDTFPSTFGTGTEDYYGYAWSSPELFQRPYHAQTRADGPGNKGNVSVNRWQIFDAIPYTKRLKFDLEMWHWADVVCTYVHTAYWYSLPGQTGPAKIDASLLAPIEFKPPEPVKGAIEGESLHVDSVSGGKTQIQSGFEELSNGKQLWWTDPGVGDKLVLSVPVAADGTYEVTANCCSAGDYGIHKITFDGHVVAPIDFYDKDVHWHRHSLGTYRLSRGEVKMTIECVGQNPAALPAHMFGLDYLILKKR